ncbi:precorrin-3B C(17)-methyltransferase [Streptomyces sp. GC420]|uniref:precorrin-3B C(17)-methyltransferase n=1 Tax=Streptomyces sp. GC420 TaxID=2697568 RepID=UPI001414ECC5|nr:precorrin-3B C(17)-methyltransferase [Streptomyces sp. GC420]NBM16348.1 precorrin-3B C(17)-methyltransferase [Streptomyces sp. GC420]
MIGLISATAAGAAARDRLAAAWPGRTKVYDGPVRESVERAFAECERLVCFLATGAVVRIVAPLLAGKELDPGVVCVDDAGRHAVALLGGHGGGANALAREVSEVLGCEPVVTTATDARGIPGLDTLGLPVEGATAAVTRAILDGERVALHADAAWPLPALPPNVRPDPAGHVPGTADAEPGPAGVPASPPASAGLASDAAHGSASRLVSAAGRAAGQGAGAHASGTPHRPHPAGVAAGETAGPADGAGAVRPADAGVTGDPTRTGSRAGHRDDEPSGRAGGSPLGRQETAVTDARPRPAGAPDPADGGSGAEYRLVVTDRIVALGGGTAVLRPPSLVVGVGASKGAPVDEVLGLVEETLASAGLSVRSVAEVATVEAKAGEPGIVGAARALGVPLRVYGAGELAGIEVPNPSRAPLDAVGTPSVAEAAALAGSGGGELLVPKRKSAPPGRAAMATCAVARRRPRGRLAVVGLGPGARDLLTPRARAELRRASVVVGLDQYVDQIRDLLLPGTRILESGLGAEEERARTAVAEARAGHAVALIGSGDAGVYAMASPALAEASADIDVVGVPGVTAALAAAAILGAPLGHDHVSISLSDLHTPWEVIERRVRAAAEADIVVTFYNPRSRGRDWQLPKALGILAEHRAPRTPVGVVRNASRPDESSRLTTLAALDPATVDMMTVVTVGNTATREVAGRMVTPRGYRWQSTATPTEENL